MNDIDKKLEDLWQRIPKPSDPEEFRASIANWVQIVKGEVPDYGDSKERGWTYLWLIRYTALRTGRLEIANLIPEDLS